MNQKSIEVAVLQIAKRQIGAATTASVSTLNDLEEREMRPAQYELMRPVRIELEGVIRGLRQACDVIDVMILARERL